MHPKKLGRYELVAVLGKGAMGVVYEGRDPNLDRRVAIKTIMVDDLAPVAATEYEHRFRTESRSAARLQHPNIVTVYDSDRDGGTAYLVMEFIHGEDLKHHLDRGDHFTLGECLRLMVDLLAALDFAHRQGIVHRDVKPANLLIEPGGRLKLTDFGVARVTGEATRTQGSMVGTLKYMAPEQVQGLKIDARADQFSAAVVAYQLFTGTRPFDGDNDFSIIHQIIGHDPAPPSTLEKGLPPAFDKVLAKAMAKDREQRYPGAAEFSAALQEAFATIGVSPAPHAPMLRPAKAAAAPAPRPARTIPGAPLAQEIELEYWREVRTSPDPRELEGFLARFPEGIYADLARKRLGRLRSDPDPDATVLQGMTLPPGTKAAPTSTLPLPREETAAPAPAAAATAAAQPAPRTPASAQGAASDVKEARRRRPKDAGAPVAATAPRRPPWVWPAAAVVLVAVIASAVLIGRSRSPAPATELAQAAPASTAPADGASAPAPSVGTAPAPAATPASAAVVAASRAPAASAPASAASRPSLMARLTRRASSAPAAPGSAPTVAAAPARSAEAPRETVAAAAPAPAAAPRGQPPGEVCKDKVFLMKQLCLTDECAKPGNQNYPACVRLREEARLREESRVRN